jgi:hypothetical protein
MTVSAETKMATIPKVIAAIAAAIVLAASPVTGAARRAAVPPPRAAPSPYCVDRGGPDGPGSSILDCRYVDYQACIAAATVRGNCVRNVEAK